MNLFRLLRLKITVIDYLDPGGLLKVFHFAFANFPIINEVGQ